MTRGDIERFDLQPVFAEVLDMACKLAESAKQYKLADEISALRTRRGSLGRVERLARVSAQVSDRAESI